METGDCDPLKAIVRSYGSGRLIALLPGCRPVVFEITQIANYALFVVANYR